MSASSSPMSEADRLKLAEKLDGELEEFIGKLPKKPYTEGFTLENMDEEIQLHPAFRTEPIVDDGQELPPLIEAMRQLKYDPAENSADELARNYKDDGNYNFKLRKYRWAIDAYTAGIKVGCGDCELNAQLLTNRAAANYRLGNYRSSLLDCERALAAKVDHLKAIVRGAESCFQMERYDEALTWCARGLQIKPEEPTLLDVRTKSAKQKKVADRNLRKNLADEGKVKRKLNELLDAIKARGIRLALKTDDPLSLENLESHSSAFGARVHLSSAGNLVWPVVFVYPEFAQTDFVREFSENDTFIAHLNQMFGSECDTPPWDRENTYKADKLKIYFEDELRNLWQINPNDFLEKILKHPGYVVSGGTPSFFILVDRSAFLTDFLRRYKTVEKV